MTYFPLYLYSEYSIHQSTVQLNTLINKLNQYHITTCAITDDGVMYGIYKYYKELVKNNIKPIVGLKVKVHVNNSFDTLLLYAVNHEGYLNLLKVSSYVKLNNNNQTIDIVDLLKLRKGVIVVSCGKESLVYNLLRSKRFADLNKYCNYFVNNFENYYVGLSCQTNADLNMFNYCYETIKQMNFKMVLTNKINQLENDDATKTALTCLLNLDKGNNKITNLTEDDYNGYFDYTYSLLYNLKAYDLLFKYQEEINNLCDYVIDLNDKKKHFPSFKIENQSNAYTEDEYLKRLAEKGLERRLQLEKIVTNKEQYYERLNYELSVIKNMGFCGYFLIIHDYIKFAVKKGIFLGPGRGSGVASLLAWSLGITDVNPLKHHLLFERFLNPERVSMPDIDIDVPDNRINEVIDYLVDKYGKKSTARISNFSRYQQKSALELACKALDINDKFYKSVKNILVLKDDLEEDNSDENKSDQLSLRELKEVNKELKEACLNYPNEIGKMLNVAAVLEGLPQNLTVHPSGYIIADANISNYSPLIKSNNEAIFQTQYQADDLEQLGLLKVDFLSSIYLHTIASMTNNIKQDIPNFMMPKDEGNQNVYQMLRNGYVRDVFQVSSISFQNLLKRMQVNSFNDIVAANALIRPGANDNINDFIDCKLGKKPVNYLHPDLQPILQETNGFIIYQEQIMLIALKFAGYSLGKADILRRAVAKKKKEVLEQERNNFTTACVNKGYSLQVANDIYDYFVRFASFGFNKAHSVSYAKFTYMTAWLKCNYPEYFYAVNMESATDSDMIDLIEESKKLGVKTFAPRINSSTDTFKSNHQAKAILMSLSMIRKLRSDIVKQILEERNKNGLFKSIEDFINRCSSFIKEPDVIKSLVFSGALNEFKMTKKDLFDAAKYYFGILKYGNIVGLLPFKPTNEEYSFSELMKLEKEALGFNLAYTFVSLYNNIYVREKVKPINQILSNPNMKYVGTFGIVKDLKEMSTKKKEKMLKITLSDYQSTIKVTLFPNVYQTCQTLAIDDKVVVLGSLDEWNGTYQINCNSIKKITE